MEFLDGATPRAIAHRGWHIDDLAGLENSLPAFRRAAAEGYRYLETDVHATADGVVVAFHDSVLDRVTNMSGPIAKLPFRDVRRALIRGREVIPTLAELLDALPEARWNIDPKSDAAVGPLLDVLHRTGAWDRVCIGSFSDHRLRTIRRAAPRGLATSLGPRQVLALRAATAAGFRPRVGSAVAAQVPTRIGRVPLVTRSFVDGAHRSGLEVHVWTIDTAAQMHALLDLGVDAILTDRPDVLRDVLDERGLWR